MAVDQHASAFDMWVQPLVVAVALVNLLHWIHHLRRWHPYRQSWLVPLPAASPR